MANAKHSPSSGRDASRAAVLSTTHPPFVTRAVASDRRACGEVLGVDGLQLARGLLWPFERGARGVLNQPRLAFCARRFLEARHQRPDQQPMTEVIGLHLQARVGAKCDEGPIQGPRVRRSILDS
eukprot:6623988-Prymnesium_polylepis.1